MRHPNSPTVPRLGVTLTEVIVSMLIMGIGVVSLATIFPASILRSIQASQLTNSAILSKNASARISFDTTVLQNTALSMSNTTWRSLLTGAATDDPLNSPIIGVVDPFGTLAKYNLPATIGGINRFSGVGTSINATLQDAERLAGLPDSWSLVREESVAGGYVTGAQQITVSAPTTVFAELSPRTTSVGDVNKPLYRLIITDVNGKTSIRRTVRAFSNNTISWVDPGGGPSEPQLPSTFTPARARLEVRENRYTWMMTVRKRAADSNMTSWNADATLVVFFNRAFSQSDEAATAVSNFGAPGFDGKPGIAGVDDDLDGSLDTTSENNALGSDDLRTLSFTTAPATLKKGSYVFESNNGVWYRVVNFDLKKKLILVDQDIIGGSSLSIISMKGIVQVYDLGKVSGTP